MQVVQLPIRVATLSYLIKELYPTRTSLISRDTRCCYLELELREGNMLDILLDRAPTPSLAKQSQALTSQQFRVLALTGAALL